MAELGRDWIARLLLATSLLGPIENFDWKLQRAIQTMAPSPLDGPMHVVSDFGKPQLVFGILLAIAAFGGPAGAATARHAVLALIPTNLVVEGLKHATRRVRPDGESSPSNASFPSSHAANAFALAFVFARRWRKAAILFYLFAALVAFSRVYLNRHFVSDVLCAALIGVASAWAIERLLARRPGIQPAREGEPAIR
jgi:undecaprenyl-diphosphatase